MTSQKVDDTYLRTHLIDEVLTVTNPQVYRVRMGNKQESILGQVHMAV